MVKNGERSSISSRVAELDQVIPQFLGVSPAILDSVIFCHQDESLWPMSEPSVLKKRFDEIFEALKYTKAIENLKVLRKKHNEELAKYKLIEEHAKGHKDKGERAEKKSSELYDEIEELRTQAETLEKQRSEAKEKTRKAFEHAATFEKLVARLDGKRIEAQALQRSVDDLRQNLKEMMESDQELNSMLDSYEDRVARYRDERETRHQQYLHITSQLDESRRQVGEKHSEIGKHEAEKAHHERQVKQRDDSIKDISRRHNIWGFDIDLTDQHIREFMERLAKLSREQNAIFERTRRETQEELQQAQKALNQLNERRSAFETNKESCKQQMDGNDRKLSTLQAEIDKVEIDEGGKAVLESTLEDIEKRLQSAKGESESANLDSQLAELHSHTKSLDDRKDALNDELIQGTKQASESARLDFLHKELKDRERSLGTMIGAHNDRLTLLLPTGWTPESIERDYQALVNQRSSEIKEAEVQRDSVSRELEQLDFKLSSVRKSLASNREELKACAQVITDATGEEDPREFEATLNDLEKSFLTQSNDAALFEEKKKYFVKCLEILRGHDYCETCQRSMRNDKERQTFTKRLETVIKKAEADTGDDELEQTKAELTTARAAKPRFDTWIRLQDQEMPSLLSEEQALATQRTRLLSTIDDQDSSLRDKQEAKREVDSMSRTTQTIARYHTDIRSFTAQIEELTAKSTQSGLSLRGLEQIKEDIKTVSDEFRSVNARLAQLNSDRDRSRNIISALELEASDVRSRLNQAVFQLREKSNLEGQARDLRSHNQTLRDSLKGLDKDLQALQPSIAQAQMRYDDINRRGAERERELQAEATKVSESVHSLKSINDEINHYVDRGGAQQLSRTRREIENLESEMARMEEEQRSVTRDINKISENLRNTDDTKRTINDNLRFRRSQRDLTTVRTEIKELEAHDAEVDRQRFDREGQKWQNEFNKLSAEQATVMGTLRSKDDQLKVLIQEWETDYKDAAFKYKEAHIKVETTKAAVEDLGRYGGALDKAIMRYHSLKMEEINRIIEELWKKTYQGTDVDTIMIRSDNENLKGNKSYNYRVVMVKQDAEMDMRGRCSAGQKVLASIIIRLALAECFGVNCGLIALDEPTTNLDRDNIRALGEALAEIIRVRRQQSNFQLIVITHDEEFLRYMNCADFADVYYRVSRNERQKSIIERQSIAEVTN